MTRADLDTLLRFFKTLADESRLRVVGLLSTHEELTTSELAALLSLKEPTVSHHLARLRDLGLVEVRREGTHRHHRLVTDELERLAKRVLAPGVLASAASTGDTEAWRTKVLRSFVDGARLTAIPASRRKREVILAWLVEQLPTERPLGELELNRLIKRHHPDAATLRRELVGAGLLTRAASVYTRPA